MQHSITTVAKRTPSLIFGSSSILGISAAIGAIWLSTAVARGGNPSIELEMVGAVSPWNHAAWWSPIAHHDGKIYVSYLAPNSSPDHEAVYVAQRNAPGAWTVQDTGVTAVNDSGHTQTSLAIDGEGYLHLFYGMHNNPIRYLKSNQSGKVTGGFTSSSPAAFSSGRYTYPNLTTASNGDVYMIIRDRRAAYADQQGRLFRYNVADQTWSEMPPFAGQSQTTVYPNHIFPDSSGDLHIIWEWAQGGAQSTRHYGSYARFDPETNKFYKADGTQYDSSPIKADAADYYQGLEGKETFTQGIFGVGGGKMTLDDQGKPIVAYNYSPTAATQAEYAHRVSQWTGTEWVKTIMTPGPFDEDKTWITFSGGVLRFYGTLAPDHPLHNGIDEIFLRTSNDYGASWSEPIPIAPGIDVQRPVGITVDNTDYLYLPSTSEGKLYVATVSVPEPSANALSLTGTAVCFVCRLRTD